MREILFRGIREDNGQWAEGLLFKYNGKTCIALSSLEGDDYGLYPNCYASVKPDSVSEFTGIYDKNFERIFEGDILKDDDGGVAVVQYGRIGYDSSIGMSGFALCESYSYIEYYEDTSEYYFECDRNFHHEEVEIIGNMHDNPELLK